MILLCTSLGFCSICSSVKKSNSIRDPKLLGWLKIKPIAKAHRARDSTVFSSCYRGRFGQGKGNNIAGNCLFTLYSYFSCYFFLFGSFYCFVFFKYYQGYWNSSGAQRWPLVESGNPKRANWMEVIEKLLKRRRAQREQTRRRRRRRKRRRRATRGHSPLSKAASKTHK